MDTEYREYHLFSCVWEITLGCNFSCRYCGSKAGSQRSAELSTQECMDIAAQLSELGCRRVSLIGGEVFLRRDWNEIAESLVQKGVNVSIVSNGYLLSQDHIEEIKRIHIESVAISLDGTKEIHDSFRQQGSFKKAIDAIDRLADNDVPVSVITTLHSLNCDCLQDMYEILKRKKIYAWQIQACSPMGNAAEGFSSNFDFTKAIRFVYKTRKESPFVVGLADNIGYYSKEEGFLRGILPGKASFFGCHAGIDCIGIDSVGNVRGCEALYDDRFIEGNLRMKRLKDIWEDENAFSYNRRFDMSLLKGKCKGCQYGYVCRGGCRSYNFFSNGELYESVYCQKNE